MDNAKKHGGARPGAGRHKKPVKLVTLRLKIDVYDHIVKAARSINATPAAFMQTTLDMARIDNMLEQVKQYRLKSKSED